MEAWGMNREQEERELYRPAVEVQPLYLRGTLRLMLYEHWQRLGVSNTYQLKPDWYMEAPRSIHNLEQMIEDTPGLGELILQAWYTAIVNDFNGGHRA
jgi:hypothetical protein